MNNTFHNPALAPNLLVNRLAQRLHLLDATIAFLCVTAYVLRLSLLTFLMNTSVSNTLFFASSTLLILAILCVLVGGVRAIDTFGMLMIVATGASLLCCERLHYVLPRWGGWVVMFWSFGPVCWTQKAAFFRSSMFSAAKFVFVMAVLLSACWWLMGLPNLGRGDFTGVMWHSMTLGAMSGFVGVVAIARAQASSRFVWYAVFGLSCILTLLASSRAALAGLALGTLIVMVLSAKRNILLSWILVMLGLFVASVPQASLEVLSTVTPEAFVSGLARKSWEHTREAHWEARWEEFLYSPLTGVGLGSAWEDTAGFDPETGAVETGSSYLAILSMTGILGASAFSLLVLSLAWKVYSKGKLIPDFKRLEICGLAGFWFVHLGAEGYIYAVGSPMALVFWLWLGCLGDEMRSLPSCRRNKVALPWTRPYMSTPQARHTLAA